MTARKKVCIVATVPFALRVFMLAHIQMLAEKYDVTLIANQSAAEGALIIGDHIRIIDVNIARPISLRSDISTLWRLYRIFKVHKFDAVHSLMPKAGLLAMLAAFGSRVPNRIHTFTGQVWANKTGLGRQLLKMLDRLIAACATNLLTDSFSQRQFLIDNKIVPSHKIHVLGNGSVCGVDMQRFRPNSVARGAIREQLAIPEEAIVLLFLGRLNPDKGILDLAQAFAHLWLRVPTTYLLLVGPDEGEMDCAVQKILANSEALSNYRRVGYTAEPENYMASADVFCLPSYREGFGSVIIEAAAVGLPAVASNIYGITDAVENGETGLLHEVKDIVAIQDALFKIVTDEKRRSQLAMKARTRASDYFSQPIIVNEMRMFYQRMFANDK